MRKIEKSIKFWRIFQSSLSYNGRLDGEDVDRLVDDWVRPGQLYHPPEMTKDGSARDDVIQGRLGNVTNIYSKQIKCSGDCWMLAAMAWLSERPRLFKQVVPFGQTFTGEEYTGLFLLRLWWYGDWVEVESVITGD